MTQPFRDHDELKTLLDALCDESISPEQMARLEELILGNPEAEAFYVQYLSLQADLVTHLASLPCPTEKTLSERAPRPRRVGRLLAWAAAGLTGVAAALLLFLLQKPPARSVVIEQSGERIDDTVALLVRSPDAVWGETELPTRAGSPLPSGWLRLKSGFAHLEFYSGVTLIVEGPAELKLVSRLEAFCAQGKLRAVVPTHAQGFRIGSPQLDLVDRGTEFGLRVEEGRTEVHVFQGKVDLYDPGRTRAAAPRQNLTTGRGLRLDGPGKPEEIATNPNAFRTALDLAQRTADEARQRHRDWLAFSASTRKRDDLRVYFPFESDDPRSRTLFDQARGRQQPHDGAIVGCTWTAGRWPGKQALAFKGVTDRVRLDVPGTFKSLTLAAWVRIDGLPNRNNALLMSDGWEPGEVHWQIGHDGMLILGVQGDPKGNGAHYHAPEAITPDRFGEWTHLAVTYDGTAGLVTHFVDGRQVGEQLGVKDDIDLRIGAAEIGNWNLAAHRNRTPIRFFSGAIDELMVFSSALAANDVRRLHDQGRPPPP